MSIKNLLLEVYDAVCRARRLGQTTNLVRVATGYGDQRFTSGILVTANKQQADQVERDAWTSGLPKPKCVSVYSLARQSRGRDPVPLYFDNHTVGDLAGRAADEIGKLEAEIKKVSRDLQNMTHRAQVAERQVEVLREQLRQYQDAVIRLSNAIAPFRSPSNGDTSVESVRHRPLGLAELLRELEQGGHLPPVPGKEGEEAP